MIITLTAAEAFAIKAAAAHRRDLRTIAARITQDAIAVERRAEAEAQTAEQIATPCPACPYAPDFDALRGVAPNATGELSSEAFVRRMRDEW